MANPIITNVAVLTRFEKMALASQVVIDGTTISVDGVLPRGTILCKASLATAKWHVYVDDTDVLAVDLVRVLQDDVKVTAAVDAFASAYFTGFFSSAALLDANTAGGLDLADLTISSGFRKIEAGEYWLLPSSAAGLAATVAALGATTNLSAISGSYADLAAARTSVNTLRGEVEARLDAVEAKVDEVIASLKAASLMA